MEPETMINTTEYEQTTQTLTLEPLGYGTAESAISHKKKVESGELVPEIDDSAQEFIKSGNGLVEVHEHDDGCIDGRCSEQVIASVDELEALTNDDVDLFISEDGEFYTSSNHERAKVAGGGYITGQVIRIGAGMKGESIEQDLADLTVDLANQNIYCGAHTGAHLKGDGTDCGANDKVRLIIQNGSRSNAETENPGFREDIKKSTEALLSLINVDFDPDTYERVMDNWAEAASDNDYFGESTGRSRLGTIVSSQEAINDSNEGEKPLTVTKHLGGSHNEAYIIVNFQEGKTFSQNALLEVLRAEFPGVEDEKLPQAFVVDAWRVAQLAVASVDEEKGTEALYAGVAFQLATAATLTDGTLKVFAYN